jgi:hypothetical protein
VRPDHNQLSGKLAAWKSSAEQVLKQIYEQIQALKTPVKEIISMQARSKNVILNSW